MYGPPADPRMIATPDGPLDAPWAWALCLGFGSLLTIFSLRGRLSAPRPAALVLGLGLVMLAPAPGLWMSRWWGDFPTTDKAGSFAMYLSGAHHGALPWAAEDTPALRLIGAHAGHLWAVAALDLALDPADAFNLISVMQPILGWAIAALYLRGAGARPWAALAMGLPFGMGLHVLRDARWYTIEKGAVFWIPLFLWGLRRAERSVAWAFGAALTFALMTWNNLYFGMVCALMGVGLGAEALGPALGGERWAQRRLLGLVGAAALSLPLVRAQAGLQGEGAGLGGPERFLTERAALDVLSLWPPRWNRLELWRAVDPLAGLLGLLGLGAMLRRRRGRTLVGVGVLLVILALGPKLALRPEGAPGAADNPVYALLVAAVPGAWRIAKPEVFFEGSLLVLLSSAALHLSRASSQAQRRTFALMLLLWAALVRSHPVFPGHSARLRLEADRGSAARALGEP